MNKTTKDNYCIIQSDAGNVLHRIGSNYQIPISKIITSIGNDSLYEEITQDEFYLAKLNELKDQLYKKYVSDFIHERYSIDDEIALINNINSLPASDQDNSIVVQEFQSYQSYRNECKLRARAVLDQITSIQDIDIS